MTTPARYVPLAELLALDDIVRRALRARHGESMLAAARRIMEAPHGDLAWRVAAVVVRGSRYGGEGQWRHLARAAKVALRIARREGEVSQ